MLPIGFMCGTCEYIYLRINHSCRYICHIWIILVSFYVLLIVLQTIPPNSDISPGDGKFHRLGGEQRRLWLGDSAFEWLFGKGWLLVATVAGLVVSRWLQIWHTGHHFENCWLILKRPPLEPKHFIVWWVCSFSSLLDRFQRFRFFWCRFFLVWRGRMTTLLDCFAGDIFSVVLQDAPENFNSQDFLRWRFDLSMILTPQTLLKWKIYWMVCCVSTRWLKKCYIMLFNHHFPGLPSSPLLER